MNGLNWYYFGARYYDPAIVRWVQVDPYDSKYPSVSPFNYAFNNPIILIDPDGRVVVFAQVEARVSVFISQFNVAGGLAIDHQGNVGVYYSGGLGAGFGIGMMAGVSFGGYPALDATINDIEGFGVDAGAWAGAGGAIIAAELNFSINNDDFRIGLTPPIGPAAGYGGGIYIQGSGLKFVNKFNIFEMIKNNFKGFGKTELYKILKATFGMSDEEIRHLIQSMYNTANANHNESEEKANNEDDSEENNTDGQEYRKNGWYQEYHPRNR